MKMIVKVLLTAAAMAAFAVPAMAADKLIINGTDGVTPVFKVDDAGIVTGAGMILNNNTKKYGFGTANPSTSLHLVELAEQFDRGLTIGQHSSAGAAAVINIKKSTGTDTNPGLPVSGANVAAFHAQVYDGNTTVANANGYSANASFFFFAEPGTYSAGNIPLGIRFETGAAQSTRKERLRITSDGRLRISNQPAAPASSLACTLGDLILDTTGGYLYLCSSATSPYWKRTAFVAY